MSKAQNVQLSEDTWINTSIMHDRDMADRLVAKVALGAGAFAGDRAFIVSNLASLLRDVLWARSSVALRFDFLAFYDNEINEIPRPPGARPIASLVSPEDASQAVFLPAPDDARRTILIVQIAGHEPAMNAVGYEANTVRSAVAVAGV